MLTGRDGLSRWTQIFLGDMNYRLKGRPVDVLADVAHLCAREKAASGLGDDWRALRYRQLLKAGRFSGRVQRALLLHSASSLLGQSQGQGLADCVGEELKDQGSSLDGYDTEEESGDEEADGDDGDEGDAPRSSRSSSRNSISSLGGVRRALSRVGRSFRSMASDISVAQAETLAHSRSGSIDRDSLGTGHVSLELGRISERASQTSEGTYVTSCHTWGELMAADELTTAMARNEVFFGFQEPPVSPADEAFTTHVAGSCLLTCHVPAGVVQIRFPPSYRRIKGRKGYCGDYTNLEVLKHAYSILVSRAARGSASRGPDSLAI
jgi:hypothetical protein